MQLSDIPVKFPIPFANAAVGADIRPIPVPSQILIQAGAASLTDGFPPACFVPPGAGGTPPWGADFNGLFYQSTAWSRWQNAGGTVLYDAAFSTAVGGYPKGAVLASTVSGLFWYNSADNNVTDPDGGSPAGWLPMGPRGTQWQRGNYAVATGTNTYAITLTPAPASYTELIGVSIRAKITNGQTSSGVTLNVNGLGPKNVIRPNSFGGGTTLFYGDISSGNIGEFVYDGINFQLVSVGSGVASMGSGVAHTTTIPNTNTPTAIFGAVNALVVIATDFGGGNAFSDIVNFYQGTPPAVTGVSQTGAPGTRTYTATGTGSTLSMALTGAPGSVAVTPWVIYSNEPTP